MFHIVSNESIIPQISTGSLDLVNTSRHFSQGELVIILFTMNTYKRLEIAGSVSTIQSISKYIVYLKRLVGLRKP